MKAVAKIKAMKVFDTESDLQQNDWKNETESLPYVCKDPKTLKAMLDEMNPASRRLSICTVRKFLHRRTSRQPPEGKCLSWSKGSQGSVKR